MTSPPTASQGDKGPVDQARANHGDDLRSKLDQHPSGAGGGWFRLGLALTARAIARPRVAIDLLAVVWAFRARRWYLTPPFLPLPPRDYLRWRMYTAYGDEYTVPPVEDVIRFARWRRKLLAL